MRIKTISYKNEFDIVPILILLGFFVPPLGALAAPTIIPDSPASVSHSHNTIGQLADFLTIHKKDQPWTCGPKVGNGIEILDFSEQELNGLLLNIEQIEASFPGLLSKVRHYRPPVLVRVNDDKLIASSNSNRILLGSLFFRESNSKKALALAHELVHIADCGCLVAYSDQWNSFISSRAETVKSLVILVKKEERKELEQFLNDAGYLPSLYAATNLVEGLAEFITKDTHNTALRESLKTRIFCTDKPEAEFPSLTSRAIDELEGKRWTEALIFCKKAELLQPNSPVCKYLKGYSFWHMGKQNEARACTRQSINLFEEQKIDVCNLWHTNALRLMASIELTSGRPERAESYYNTIIENDSANSEILNLRASTLEARGKYFLAIKDLLRAKGILRYSWQIQQISKNRTLCANIDKELKQLGTSQSKLCRAEIYNALASSALTEENKLKLLVESHSLFQSVVEDSVIQDHDNLLLMLAWQSLELSEPENALRFLEKIDTTSKEFSSAKIIQSIVINYRHNGMEESQFKQLKQEILKFRVNQERFNNFLFGTGSLAQFKLEEAIRLIHFDLVKIP